MSTRMFRVLVPLCVALAAATAAAQEPVASTYSVRTPSGITVNVAYSTVIVPGDGQNTVDVLIPPAHGTVVNPPVIDGTNQAFAYTPTAGYSGIDEFLYRVRDGTGDVSFAYVIINVGNVQAIAGDDEFVVPTLPDNFLDIFFNDNGFADPVSFLVTQSPAHGTLTLEIPSPAWQSLIGVYYTPAPGYDGPDQFQYQIGDGIDVDVATVTLNVSPDSDGDDVLDFFDNCPAIANPDQFDYEQDGIGDVCDPDDDNDVVADVADNCVLVPNAGQLDSNGDGYGNICDADLDNSGLTTAADYNLLRSMLNRASTFSALAAAADMNGSGLVTASDYILLRGRVNTAPGPSGLVP